MVRKPPRLRTRVLAALVAVTPAWLVALQQPDEPAIPGGKTKQEFEAESRSIELQEKRIGVKERKIGLKERKFILFRQKLWFAIMVGLLLLAVALNLLGHKTAPYFFGGTGLASGVAGLVDALWSRGTDNQKRTEA